MYFPQDDTFREVTSHTTSTLLHNLQFFLTLITEINAEVFLEEEFNQNVEEQSEHLVAKR